MQPDTPSNVAGPVPPAAQPLPATPEILAPAAVPAGFAGWRSALAIVTSVLVVDHVVKWLAIVHLKPILPDSISIIPGLFQLTYAENKGAAFSFLHGHVEVLTVISFVVSLMMVWWWTRLPKEEVAGRTAFAFVVGGAVGNLIDRAFRGERFGDGYVVDMFDAYVRGHHWPVFNIADSCICLGMAVLVWRMWKGKI